MSRKAEDIKLRVTTLEKGWWQRLAADEETSLSELIRRVMNERVTALASTDPTLESVKVITPAEIEKLFAGPPPSQEDGPVVIKRGWPPVQADSPEDEMAPRRSEDCSCGKASYVFCRACDG